MWEQAFNLAAGVYRSCGFGVLRIPGEIVAVPDRVAACLLIPMGPPKQREKCFSGWIFKQQDKDQ